MPNTDELHAIVERLDAAAAKVEQVAEQAALDRQQISRLLVLTQRLIATTTGLEKTAEHVAEDLAASIVRADEAPVDTPGAGADAALRSAGETAAHVAAEKNEFS